MTEKQNSLLEKISTCPHRRSFWRSQNKNEVDTFYDVLLSVDKTQKNVILQLV